jgi:excisionase family DNA binding protein
MKTAIRDEIRAQKRDELSEKLLTPQETADLLRVSKVTLWQWERDGRIVKHSIGGRTYFKYHEIMAKLQTLQRYKKPA